MKVKILKKNELRLLFFYIKFEGWSIDELHMKALHATHPNDFFIAFKGDELIGFILAIKESDKFGFISTFLVLKEFRSLGFGKIIFRHALQHLAGCQIALDSVIGYEKFYKAFGFKTYFETYTYKYIIVGLKIESSDIKISNFNKKTSLQNKNKYQKYILKSKNVTYKETKQKGHIVSFSYMYKYIDGYKIVIESNNINEALALFLTLTQGLENKIPVYLEVSKVSPLLLEITKNLNMKIDSKFTRMYNKIIA